MRRASLLLLMAGVIPAMAYEVELDIMEVTGMAVDAAGSVYLSGYDWSTTGSLTRQPQVLRKLDATGTSVYTVQVGELTYTNPLLPPTGIQVSGVAVDKAGSVYITGFVNQAGLQTVNAAQPFPRGQGDAFVAKLTPDGAGLVYFTYLGGSGRDQGRKIAVDTDGNAYVSGSTCSTDFPTVNAAQPSFSGGDFVFACEGFVTKLDPTGSRLVYSTYLGGSKDDYGAAIACDDAGNAYVTGVTASPDFPIAKPFQAQMTCNSSNLCRDAFVTKLDASGAIVYSTFLGGSSYEQAEGIAADPAGNAYVTGTTGSCDFPTVNALQPSPGDHGGSCADAFVVKVDPQGQLIYSTYLGGEGAESGGAITADADGNAYVTGGTYTTDFPTVNPIQEPALGTAFIAKLDAAGAKLLFSTYYGVYTEERETQGVAIALDGAGNLYVSAERVGGFVSAEFVLKIDVSRMLSTQ